MFKLRLLAPMSWITLTPLSDDLNNVVIEMGIKVPRRTEVKVQVTANEVALVAKAMAIIRRASSTLKVSMANRILEGSTLNGGEMRAFIPRSHPIPHLGDHEVAVLWVTNEGGDQSAVYLGDEHLEVLGDWCYDAVERIRRQKSTALEREVAQGGLSV